MEKLNQSVRKAITLLRATAEDADANVSSLARAAGLPRATALRMIQTLEQEGFLLRIPGDDRVLLGPELLRLARNTDEQLLLREVSRPVIGGGAEKSDRLLHRLVELGSLVHRRHAGHDTEGVRRSAPFPGPRDRPCRPHSGRIPAAGRRSGP